MEILVTPRLTLRPPIALDADDIAHWLSDWDVTKMLGRVPWPYSLDEAEKWIANAKDPEKRIYTIHRQSLIGVAGLIGSGHTPTLAYWLAKPYHGHGFMREALSYLLDLAFSDPNITAVQSGVAIDNVASLNLQRSLGFQIIGEEETYSVPRKSAVTLITTRLTSEAWLERTNPYLPAQSQQQHASLFAA